MTGKLTIEEINALSRERFVERFGSLYERSPWVAERAWEQKPFGSLEEMSRAFERAMREASGDAQLALILAHPDLAGKAAIAGDLTPESTREQTSAGLDRLSPEEYERFMQMNAEYREKFGIPMIVCVREHTKESILAQAEARLERSREEEIGTALDEIDKIANLRLQDQIEPGPNEAAGAKAAEDSTERAGG